MREELRGEMLRRGETQLVGDGRDREIGGEQQPFCLAQTRLDLVLFGRDPEDRGEMARELPVGEREAGEHGTRALTGVQGGLQRLARALGPISPVVQDRAAVRPCRETRRLPGQAPPEASQRVLGSGIWLADLLLHHLRERGHGGRGPERHRRACRGQRIRRERRNIDPAVTHVPTRELECSSQPQNQELPRPERAHPSGVREVEIPFAHEDHLEMLVVLTGKGVARRLGLLTCVAARMIMTHF